MTGRGRCRQGRSRRGLAAAFAAALAAALPMADAHAQEPPPPRPEQLGPAVDSGAALAGSDAPGLSDPVPPPVAAPRDAVPSAPGGPVPAGPAPQPADAAPRIAAPLIVAPNVDAASASAAISQAVLTVDQEAIYRQSAWGRRADAELAAQSRQVAADNDRAFADLVADEDALTAARPTLPAEEFRSRAAAFDERVTTVRQERDAARAALQTGADRERALFYQAAAPVIGRVMAARGALVVLDQRTVLISDERIDVTAEIVAALDAELGDGAALVAAAVGMAGMTGMTGSAGEAGRPATAPAEALPAETDAAATPMDDPTAAPAASDATAPDANLPARDASSPDNATQPAPAPSTGATP